MVFKVGMIDIFGKNKGIPLNSANATHTHGEVVAAIIETLTSSEKIQIIKYKAKPRKDNICHIELKSLLKQLKKINKGGSKILDYLNLSTAAFFPTMPFGENGHILALPIIKRQLLSDIQNEKLGIPTQVKHILEELDRITKDGTKVVVSSGNSSHKFNLFSLCDKVYTVGGLDVKTQKPIQWMAHNPLVDTYMPLPLYMQVKQTNFIKDNNLKTIDLSKKFDLQHEFAKLSKQELKKRIANSEDYKLLAQIIQNISQTKKYLIFDINFMCMYLQRFVPENLQNKIYEIDKFQEIFKAKFDKEILESVEPQGTHCDLTYTQFFNMSCKGEKHVVSQKKTTKVRQSLLGSSFCPAQYIAQDINGK